MRSSYRQTTRLQISPTLGRCATGCDIFPRFHIESLNEISKLTVSGATPLRSLLRVFVRILRMGRNVILAGTLRAPRLFPPGALLWILPNHSGQCTYGGAPSKIEGKIHVRFLERCRLMKQQDKHLELRYVLPEAFDKLFIFKQALVSAHMSLDQSRSCLSYI